MATAAFGLEGVVAAWLLAYPILLVVYLLAFVVFGLTMLRYECPHCIHSNCPSRMNYVQRIEIEG